MKVHLFGYSKPNNVKLLRDFKNIYIINYYYREWLKSKQTKRTAIKKHLTTLWCHTVMKTVYIGATCDPSMLHGQRPANMLRKLRQESSSLKMPHVQHTTARSQVTNWLRITSKTHSQRTQPWVKIRSHVQRQSGWLLVFIYRLKVKMLRSNKLLTFAMSEDACNFVPYPFRRY